MNDKKRIAELEDVLKEIISGKCPPSYPMTMSGLVSYHLEIAKKALKGGN